MNKIIITMEVAEEYADPDHGTGLTNEGFERLFDMLSRVGSDIDFQAVPS